MPMAINSRTDWIRENVCSEVHIAPLVTTRILFGLLIAFSTIRFMAFGWVNDHFICPNFHFKYFGFEWVEIPGAFWVYAIHVLLILFSLFVALGFFYRLSALFTFLLFTYIQLWDATYYLNHYYFISLFALLMALVPAHGSYSVDTYRNPSLRSSYVPVWTINILKLQLAIVYIFAGVAKINAPWLLEALPLKIWLPSRAHYFLVGALFDQEWVAYVFSWVGMLYDLFIVFLLINRRTRFAGFILVVVFHLLTRWLFPIGVFPFVMIFMTLIFFSEQWHIMVQNKLANFFNFPAKVENVNAQLETIRLEQKMKGIFKFGLLMFFVFQLIFPFRYLLYKDSLFWKEQGYRFSWRVMLIEKAGVATFYINEKGSDRKGEVYNNEFLTAQQQKQLAIQPDFILQYAHFLKAYFEKNGMKNPEVRAQVYVTLNSKPSTLYIDSSINLADLKDSWSPRKWVLPYPY